MRFYQGLLLLFVVFLIGASCRCSKSPDSGESANTFALLFTASVRGWVEPCGCTSEPLGGVARLASVVQEAKRKFKGGTVLLDGGDLLFDTLKPIHPADQCQGNARIDLLLGTLRDLGAIGTFAGPFDDVMGKDFRNERYAKFGIKDLTIDAREGFLTGSQAFQLGVLLLEEQNASILDEKASALKKRGAAAIVAVTRLSRQKTRALASGLRAVDVIILAAELDEKPAAAEKLGDGPVMMATVKQGQSIGMFTFTFQGKNEKWTFDDREQKRLSRLALLKDRESALEVQLNQASDQQRQDFLKTRISETKEEIDELQASAGQEPLQGNVITASLTVLSRTIKPDPEFDSRLKAYEGQIPELVAQCEAGIACPSLEKDQPSFVGAQTCKQCHSAAYDFWKSSIHKITSSTETGEKIMVDAGHARAWETLESKNKIQDRSCVECHSTGFMQPGGFCKVKEVGKFEGVQCEACHGAGSQHAKTANKRYIKRDVPESTCRGCHHVPHIPTTESFVYAEKLESILGKGHGELFLDKIRHTQNASTPKNGLKDE